MLIDPNLPIHRCRLFRMGDDVALSNSPGMFTEIYDVCDGSLLSGSPKPKEEVEEVIEEISTWRRRQGPALGECVAIAVGDSMEKVKAEIEDYRIKHGILNCRDY